MLEEHGRLLGFQRRNKLALAMRDARERVPYWPVAHSPKFLIATMTSRGFVARRKPPATNAKAFVLVYLRF